MITRLKSFVRETRANVSIVFAMSALPMMAMVGAGIDYGVLTNTRTELKIATDAAALALTHNATDLSAADLQTAATNMVTGAMTNKMSTLSVTGTYDQVNSKVIVSANGTVDTKVMNAIGISSLSTSARSSASLGGGRLRVALVLDVTGSMGQDGKIQALRTATTNLLDILVKAGSSSHDVYVSVVPFDVDVNIGTSNINASWLNWSDWDENNGRCKNSSGSNKSYYSKSSCQSHGYIWTATSHSSWGGCVMDRNQNYDTVAIAPTASDTNSYFIPDNYGSSCPPAAMGLSTDFTGMKNFVAGLTPLGSTNQAIGLALGWQTLVGGGPFSAPAEDANYKYDHVIILLSDGLNTQDRWYGDSGSIDARQAIACSNAKAAGLKIYTIQVDTGGDGESQVLKDCATSGEYFSVLTSADQILGTLTNIGNGLGKVALDD